MRNICVLGATGSIGDSTLAVVEQHPEEFQIRSLAAHKNWEKILQLARRHQVHKVCLSDPDAAARLRREAQDLEVLESMDGLQELAADSETDTVVNGLVGAVGCLPTLRAVESGKLVALANKETMVMAGPVIHAALDANPKARIAPVDSEHNAIFQCLSGRPQDEVESLQLTASGGPFRELPKDKFAQITVEEALKHPTWSMGRKITIDSATMMNKGLEVIEAHFLFRIPYDQIRVVVHPRSVVHSLVQFRDGSLMAQLGVADMKVPIQVALTWPRRLHLHTGRLDLAEIGELRFYPPDFERFPCLQLAYDAGKTGGTAPAILNAANEVLVAAFLDRRISFLDIPKGLEYCLGAIPADTCGLTLPMILEADAHARELAQIYVAHKAG
ncbi:MAG TPA: 1-deoxy-D-xylulose-5-phosphate reductoisomerase [Fibrobacteraceae bacterium]|nr:1-deoxy-D-xylulose-5-phosphate reductoisomerase [Fibrobacteraceae bacterium]